MQFCGAVPLKMTMKFNIWKYFHNSCLWNELHSVREAISKQAVKEGKTYVFLAGWQVLCQIRKKIWKKDEDQGMRNLIHLYIAQYSGLLLKEDSVFILFTTHTHIHALTHTPTHTQTPPHTPPHTHRHTHLAPPPPFNSGLRAAGGVYDSRNFEQE